MTDPFCADDDDGANEVPRSIRSTRSSGAGSSSDDDDGDDGEEEVDGDTAKLNFFCVDATGEVNVEPGLDLAPNAARVFEP